MFTVAHWLFYIIVVLIILLISMRKQPMLLAAIGLVIIGFAKTPNFVSALDIAFRAIILVATNLLPVIILIGLVVAMTNLLKDTGTSEILTAPFARLKGKALTYWVLGLTMWGLTLLIWPTPAATLLGPVALVLHRQGKVHPMVIAMGLSIFGEGLGLSGDFFIQGAPSLTSKITGIPTDIIVNLSWPYIILSGIVAAVVGYFGIRRLEPNKSVDVLAEKHSPRVEEVKTARRIAWVVLAGYALVILTYAMGWASGESTTGIAGGITLVIIVMSSVIYNKGRAFTSFINYLRQGFRFSMEVFTPIVIMSSFFLLGTTAGNHEILRAEGVGFLGDFAQYLSQSLPLNKWSAGIFVILTAALGSMDGSGFSGLALAGGVAVAFSEALNLSTIPLAILGQIAAIWTGAVLVPWGFNAIIAAIVGVDPVELARNNIRPYLSAILTAYLLIMLFY